MRTITIFKECETMYYIGIDPGQKGGIAVINERNALLDVFPYSNTKLFDIAKFMSNVDEDVGVMCFIEDVHSMPKQGVASTFAFGKGFGYILGVVESSGIPYQLVSPNKWKKHFGLNSDKNKSVEMAKRFFPAQTFLPTSRCTKPSDGMAEACLIALYGKRTDRG